MSALDGYEAEAGIAGPQVADITVRLVAAEPRFDELAATQGLSPADRDPHDERYVIEVTESGIDVRAVATEGLVRALSSLTQLIAGGAQDGGVLPCQTIVDGPRFAWRGPSFDVVRTFFTPVQVKKVIDMLALHRMNVLRLHLTDSQGWRLEIPSLPTLTEIGGRGAIGNRPGGYYSQADFAEILDYAAARFITIIPEIDVPGHTGAMFASYPELRPPELPPALGLMAIEYLDPRMDATRAFLTEVFGYLATITPAPTYTLVAMRRSACRTSSTESSSGWSCRSFAPQAKVVGWQVIARGELATSDVAQYWIRGLGDVDEMFDDIPAEITIPEEMKGLLIEQFRQAAQDVPKAQAQGAGILLSPNAPRPPRRAAG